MLSCDNMQMAKARKPRRDTYHHGDLRRTLLEVAFAHVERSGPDSLSLREVARAAGVSHAAPYRHFADLDALLAAMAEEAFSLLHQALVEATQSEADPLDRFRAQGEAFINFACEHPAHYRVMFSRHVPPVRAHPALEQAGQAAFGDLLSAIVDCQKARQLRRGDPERMAVAAWAMVHGMALLLIDRRIDRDLSTDARSKLIRDTVEVVVTGLV
jgi:AcrR family transcriptional regulator